MIEGQEQDNLIVFRILMMSMSDPSRTLQISFHRAVLKHIANPGGPPQKPAKFPGSIFLENKPP